MIFIRSEEFWHRQQTSLDKFIKLQLLGSANTFTVNTQNVRGMLIDRLAQECSVETGVEGGKGVLEGGVGGCGGLPFNNFAECGLSKKCKKVVHPIVH